MKSAAAFSRRPQNSFEGSNLDEDQIGETDLQEFERNSLLAEDMKIVQLDIEATQPSQGKSPANRKPKGTTLTAKLYGSF